MKTISTVAALLCAAAWSFGQGQVTFINSSSTLISTNSDLGAPPSGPISATPGTFFFGLFAANSTVTSVSGVNDPNWTFTGFYATNTASPGGGRLSGGQPILGSPYASGTTWNFLIRGWESTLAGPDWNAARLFMTAYEAGGITVGQHWGVSSIATIMVGGAPQPVANLFGITPGTIPGFTLDGLFVPEPSTFALAGLGMAGLLMLRKKSSN